MSPQRDSAARPHYWDEEFDKFVGSMLSEQKIPGAVVAVVDGQEIYSQAYGVVHPNGSPMTVETLFNMASMGKSFTASAMALLVEDNVNYPHVKWETPVSSLMRDEFLLSDAYNTQNVTILDMLSHRSGLPRHDEVCMGRNAASPSTPESIVRALRHLPATAPLRTKFQYNNLMYIAASRLVETITGESFAQNLKHRFWDPLGMKSTFLGYDPISMPTKTTSKPQYSITEGFHWNKEAQKYDSVGFVDEPEAQGAGNIISNAIDWARWLRAMIHRTSELSAESLEELTRPRILKSDNPKFMTPYQSPLFYGMGWCIEYYRGHTVYSHGGCVPGHQSWMAWLPEQRWGFVILGNSDGMGSTGESLGWTLLDARLSIPKTDRTDWAQVQREREAVDEDGDEDELPFSTRPEHPLPMQLPLPAYAGRYSHPAYHDFLLELKDGRLFADASDRSFGFTITLEHFSGNHFIALSQPTPKWFDDDVTKLKAQFEVNFEAVAERLGIDFIDDAVSDYIWFMRVET